MTNQLQFQVPVRLFVCLLVCVLASGKDDNDLPLCEVLADLTSLNGKQVAVRGILESGPHGRWLRSAACKKTLTSEKHIWLNDIALEEDSSPSLDLNSLAAFQIQLESFKGDMKRSEIVVTYVGKLEARLPLEVAHYPDGRVAPAGVGPFNVYPALLRYRSIRNIVIQRAVDSTGKTTQQPR